MTSVVTCDNPENLTRYDSGLKFPNDPDREAHYRAGWLIEALACLNTAERSHSTSQLMKRLNRRENAAHASRLTACHQAYKTARKRAGRNARRPLFSEDEQCVSRLNRGRMQAVSTIKYALVEMLGKSKTQQTMESVCQLLDCWLDEVFEWAVCTDPNDSVGKVCPKFLHESAAFGSAVEQ